MAGYHQDMYRYAAWLSRDPAIAQDVVQEALLRAWKSLDKLREARKIIDASGRDIRLEIDGGVKVDNIREIKEAGADTFVAGSAVFGAASDSDPNTYDSVIKAFRAELAKAGS